MFLKNRYGVGFNIALMCDEKATDSVDAMVRARLPGVEAMQSTAGYLVYSVPRRALHMIPSFFELIENASEKSIRKNELPTVYEWGISNADLEEVFLRLAVKSTGLNAKLGGMDDQTEQM